MLFALSKENLFSNIGFVSYSIVSLEMSFHSFLLASDARNEYEYMCVLGADKLFDTISKWIKFRLNFNKIKCQYFH